MKCDRIPAMVALAFALALCSSAHAPEGITPPFHPAWSYVEKGFASGLSLMGSTYVFQEGQFITALDLANGRVLWSRPWNAEAVTLSCPSDPGTLFVGLLGWTKRHSKADPGAVVQLDPKTGKTIAYLRTSVEGCCERGGVVYAALKGGVLRAIDWRSKRTMWTSAPLAGGVDLLGSPVLTPNTVVVETGGSLKSSGDTIGVDRRTGKRRWRRAGAPNYTDLPLYVGGCLVSGASGLIGIDPDSGKLLWEHDDGEECLATTRVGNDLVCCYGRTLSEIDPANGRVIWTYRLRPPEDSDLPIQAFLCDQTLIVTMDPCAAVTLDGKELWRSSAIDGNVLWSDGETIATEELGVIHGYRHGALAAIPQDARARRQMAGALCDRLAGLDDAERDQLARLGPEAFAPLLEASIKAAESYERGHDWSTENLIDALPGMLSKVVTGPTCVTLRKAIRAHPVNHWVGAVLLPALLMSPAADEKGNVDVCLWVLARAKPTAWPGDESSMALSYLRVCSDPRARNYVRKWDKTHPSRRPRGHTPKA